MNESWYLKYIVKYKGIDRLILSHALMKSQKCEENLYKIKAMHATRLDIEDAMQDTRNEEELRKLGREWTMCQFELQKLWKFPEDEKWHRFWTLPRCRCPQMDNEDRYPNDQYVISHDCPVRGPTKEELLGIKNSVPSARGYGIWDKIKRWFK